MAAALVLSLGGAAYQAAVVAPGLQQQVAEAEGIQPARWHFLSLSRSELAASSGSARTRGRGGLTLSKGSMASFAYYRCELQDPDGRVVTTVVVPAPAKGDELNLALSRFQPSPGPYVLVLHGLASPSGPVVKPGLLPLPFRLERE